MKVVMIRKSRKLTYDQKLAMQEQKDRICEEQQGKCFFCGIDFNATKTIPQAAHRIIYSVVNIRKYGHEVLDHQDNFRITCSDCNVKAVISPDKYEGRMLLEKIWDDIGIN